MTFNRDESLRMAVDHGDLEDLRSLMIDFRKLLANDDDAHFYSICRLVDQKLMIAGDEKRLDQVRGCRTAWKQAFVGQLKLSVNGQEAQGQQLLDLWLNGRLFHDDPEAARFLDALDKTDVPAVLAAGMFQQEINSMIIDGLRVALAMRYVVEDILETDAGRQW